VVLADHNRMNGPEPRYVSGVLVLTASEISSGAGHLVGLGLPRALDESERKGDAVGAIRALGAVPVAAHPLNRKRPYDALQDPRLGGMEVLSADDMFREALASPSTLIAAALAYPANPEHAAVQLLERPGPTLARWDGLLAQRAVAGFCAVDAHGRPPYESVMRVLATYAVVGSTPTGDAARDGEALLEALRSGRFFCGVDALGDAAGFRFTARAGGQSLPMGSTVSLASVPDVAVELAYELPPSDAVIQVTCAGARQDTRRTGALFVAAPKPGACRVEVLLGKGADGQPADWIISNPIYFVE